MSFRGSWAGLMYESVALLCHFPVTLTGVNSWQGQKDLLRLFSRLLQSSLYSSTSTHHVLFLAFFRFLPGAAPALFTHFPSRTLSIPRSYISESMGTTSTCSSANVCINQIEGPVALDDLKVLNITHSHLFIPTSELVDSGLLCHVGEGNDALWKITRSLIHFYKCMGTHVATGIVGYVDSITASTLGKKVIIILHFLQFNLIFIHKWEIWCHYFFL